MTSTIIISKCKLKTNFLAKMIVINFNEYILKLDVEMLNFGSVQVLTVIAMLLS